MRAMLWLIPVDPSHRQDRHRVHSLRRFDVGAGIDAWPGTGACSAVRPPRSEAGCRRPVGDSVRPEQVNRAPEMGSGVAETAETSHPPELKSRMRRWPSKWVAEIAEIPKIEAAHRRRASGRSLHEDIATGGSGDRRPAKRAAEIPDDRTAFVDIHAPPNAEWKYPMSRIADRADCARERGNRPNLSGRSMSGQQEEAV